ncbi:hypothetical protein BDZ94DRAFT_1273337 [Collybia nuda]|uniref:Uncharacterized protein n=1 Tax=Collybia nuda TaxID=64659 RepID=A0A9P5XVL8_9AGAR|nr:hypothetical protein BDZ94DRAFT_1273337 [Collybia nuda]
MPNPAPPRDCDLLTLGFPSTFVFGSSARVPRGVVGRLLLIFAPNPKPELEVGTGYIPVLERGRGLPIVEFGLGFEVGFEGGFELRFDIELDLEPVRVPEPNLDPDPDPDPAPAPDLGKGQGEGVTLLVPSRGFAPGTGVSGLLIPEPTKPMYEFDADIDIEVEVEVENRLTCAGLGTETELDFEPKDDKHGDEVDEAGDGDEDRGGDGDGEEYKDDPRA